jgi:hypothetical protein
VLDKPRRGRPRSGTDTEAATTNPDDRCYFITHPELLEDEAECRGKPEFCNGCREFICEEHARNVGLIGEHDPEEHLIDLDEVE